MKNNIVLPTVTAICAIGKSGQLGLDGSIPWYDSADLARFKMLTMGATVICGHNTAQKLPTLYNRSIYVPGRNETPLSTLRAIGVTGDPVYLIGGAKLFAKFAIAGLVRTWDITKIDYDGHADCWFNPNWLII